MAFEPFNGRGAGGLELAQVGVEMPAIEWHQMLGLQRPLVGLERKVRNGDGVFLHNDDLKWRRADAVDGVRGFVLATAVKPCATTMAAW